MQSGFALELSEIDFWSIDLLDTHLDLIDTDIPSKYFVFLHRVIKTSKICLQDIFKTFLQDMSSRRPQDVFNVTIFRLSKTRLQQMFAGM